MIILERRLSRYLTNFTKINIENDPSNVTLIEIDDS